MNQKKVLYISYDGLCEPLGQSQVLSYLCRLSNHWDMEVLSFEKPGDLRDIEKMNYVSEKCKKAGITWKALQYHKRPSLLATFFDILMAWIYVLKAGRRGVRLIHCRSYVAMLMGLPFKIVLKKPIIFDMRGFWADEKVDARVWKRGLLYSLVKKLEVLFLRHADQVISLTEKAVNEILSWPSSQKLRREKFNVISTCVAADEFPWVSDFPDQFCLGYVGGAQLWYDFPRVLGLFNAILVSRPSATLHIVNRFEHDYIKKCLRTAGVPMSNVILEGRQHHEMADVYKNFSFGVFFIRDFYSKKASMPTKLAEFMATGTPVITGRGIGDVDSYIENYNSGVLLGQEPQEKELKKINEILEDPDVRKRCRELAEKEFSLDLAISKIDSIYRHLSSQA